MQDPKIELQKLTAEPKIAYFSMEIGFRSDMPTYSGGLGILAGDTIRSAADLNLPVVAVSLIHRKGYFRQSFDEAGRQMEHPEEWNPEKFMVLLPHRVQVKVEGRDVSVRAWIYDIRCPVTDYCVPVFFLDTDTPENAPEDRGITDYLYGGDDRTRLKQEIVLGIGGVLILRAMGFRIKKYHMNEGHASLLTLELLRRYRRDIEAVWDERQVWDVERVKDLCVFTTHTPVEAGHDKFPYEMVKEVVGEIIPVDVLKDLGGRDRLNMTRLAMNLSKYINGVAKKHGEVSKELFPGYEIKAVTNGIHTFTWTSESFAKLFDRYIPGWANEPELFVRVDRIPEKEIWDAHMEEKKKLIDFVNGRTGEGLDYDTLTIGFARRATAYKRAYLLFWDIERLKKMGAGKIQVVMAGKAHPRDSEGKRIIEGIFEKKRALQGSIKVVYLENYNMDLAKLLVSGVDVWLNTPKAPHEASGTSGMKAAHNGVLNMSVLDGWWIEGHMEGYTGWSVGPAPGEPLFSKTSDASDAEDLYRKLETEIMPTYYENRHIWVRMMANAIGKNAYYFNSHRMMRRYVTEAYIK